MIPHELRMSYPSFVNTSEALSSTENISVLMQVSDIQVYDGRYCEDTLITLCGLSEILTAI